MRALIGALLLVTALAFPASAVAQLLSPNPGVLTVKPDGTLSTPQSAGFFFSTMTPGARYVVFSGLESDFLGTSPPPGPLIASQWLLLDRASGNLRMISVNAAGAAQNVGGDMGNAGFAISISDDANRIIFNSAATNLDPAATTGARHCYLWDRAVGHAVAVDVDPLPGLQARPCGNITADGREVVALCSQPVAGVTGFGVCVRNLDTGVIERLALGRGAGIGHIYEALTKISADGSTVAFGGWQGTTEIGVQRVDRATGEVVNVTNEAASPFSISLSADGRLLLADSRLYDHATGQLRTVIRRPPATFPSRLIFDAVLSRDGRFAAFRTSAGEFERPFTGLPFGTGRIQVYRLDLATDRLELVSRVGLDGPIADQSHDPCENPMVLGCFFNRFSPRISGDGRFVVFQFPRANLAPSYPAGDVFAPQLFIKDMGPAAPLVNAVPVPLDRRWLILGLGLSLLLLGGMATARRV
jgi:hypothetical protein